MFRTVPPAIICFSHLRWDSVFQRPHHLLTRLARTHPVYLFEEPIQTDADEPGLEMTSITPTLHVCQPRVRSNWGFFGGDATPMYAHLLRTLLQREGLEEYIFWFYTPMAMPIVRDFRPLAVVYDCMDELSRFKFAPAEICQLEDALLGTADLVFTGGPSLYAAKKDRHPHVHCFPSSVDTGHFARAASDAIPVNLATAALPHPRLGFYGVIDERIDLDLVDGLAAARPDWQVIMVGPVVKIERAALPDRPNLHWLGKADYRDLPAHLAGWQVALMPFARNEATDFISPTKTLEYMAAAKPIVSTSIRDVVQPYGDVVAIADTVEDAVRACEHALAEDKIASRRRLDAYARILAATSWDRTAAQMQGLLAGVVRQRTAPSIGALDRLDSVASAS